MNKEKQMIKDFIRYCIHNNDIYKPILDEYAKDEDPDFYVNQILEIFYDFFAEYSIYYIMDSIIYHMENEYKTCREILENRDDFTLCD